MASGAPIPFVIRGTGQAHRVRAIGTKLRMEGPLSAFPKIVIGALATTAAAWFLHGPLGLGERCAAEARAADTAPPLNIDTGGDDGFNTEEAAAGQQAPTAGQETPATAEAAAACQAEVAGIASSGTINFATGGSGLAPDSGALVDRIATALKNCSGVSVEVAGHTDAQGSASSNHALSQQRAEAVVAALVQRGVPAARLTAKGYGETKPVDPSGPENNPRNRRIEFTVTTRGATVA